MAVGDALAIAGVLFQAVGVVVIGAFDALMAQPQADPGDIGGHFPRQDRLQMGRQAVAVDPLGVEQGQGLRRRVVLDRAGLGTPEIQADAAIPALQFQAGVAQRHDQGVIGTAVQGALQALFDLGEVQHHGLVVQSAVQLDVHDPAFAHQAALRVQVGAIDHAELFDEKTGHEAGGGRREAGGGRRILAARAAMPSAKIPALPPL